MSWVKKPRRRPQLDLTTEHLDTLTAECEFNQSVSSRASLDLGYPVGTAGYGLVYPWYGRNGNAIMIYYAWSGAAYKRTFYNGAWRPWTNMLGQEVT